MLKPSHIMNEDLAASARFKNISNVIATVFLALTLILIPVFAYMFANYWLLFGIAFSILGYFLKDLKPEKIFFAITIAIAIYWYNAGFRFSDPYTFFWFSFLFGSIFKAFVIGYDDSANKIIEMKASDMNSEIISGISHRQKNQNHE